MKNQKTNVESGIVSEELQSLTRRVEQEQAKAKKAKAAARLAKARFKQAKRAFKKAKRAAKQASKQAKKAQKSLKAAAGTTPQPGAKPGKQTKPKTTPARARAPRATAKTRGTTDLSLPPIPTSAAAVVLPGSAD